MEFSVLEWIYKNVFIIIRFRRNQKYRKHVHGDDIQDALSPSTAIFWFISDETTYQNKSLCLILDVDGFLSIFCMKYLFIGIFHIFNMASKMAAKGHWTIFFIIGLNKSFIY